MKICLAQTEPVAGNIAANIQDHLSKVREAIDQSADFIIFSELSLTGYEPEMVKDLALDLEDSRLDEFQTLSDTHNIIICIGAPTKADNGVHISLIIIKPHQVRSLYAKQYLHADELPYFVAGPKQAGIIKAEKTISLAICYELTIPAHCETAKQNESEIYIASVAKTVNGVARNNPRLSEIAKTYEIPVLMCNCVGEFDGNIGGGQSGVWDLEGKLTTNLDKLQTGILIYQVP
ncbi:carbon-nitrogen hydrolase family protein [Roseivirga misakiensis]|uniref:CN hydrolase domain-containing protein n=1 Tax=Roseivirga misakiensis TaxID=1563681 RepID=A0A1E5T538_9BACT|nr:carbon-nitrogen hydrolase family protein [Roseivirga misakiensis]OEK06484.1 hypothetical protein BFP71_02065 [Roseivirga misakiensis]